MKILIVEDEDSLREVMIRSLEKERYVVESAANYQDALLKINDYDYDCIVLDIMLPGGSGLSLLEELKKMRKKDSVIIVSAKDSIEDKVTGSRPRCRRLSDQAFPPGRVECPDQMHHPPETTGWRNAYQPGKHYCLPGPPCRIY